MNSHEIYSWMIYECSSLTCSWTEHENVMKIKLDNSWLFKLWIFINAEVHELFMKKDN